ncbi:MAG: dihydroorotate dehydrogenase electron transfer subunit [Clostridiales bacterium]|nr:dihydroorotate dehydrogenase electron transfer subunit [Clostridiales bacterium]
MKDITLTIQQKRETAKDVWEITLVADSPLPPIHCGQFLHLRVGGEYLLRRPFCIYKFTDTSVSIVVAVVGGGTRRLVRMPEGARMQAILPIGNGFTLGENHRKIVLLGGGVGCAPLASVPVTYPDREYISYLGFADKSMVQFEDTFAAFGKTVVTTDNGTYGKRGYVTDVLRADMQALRPDVILTCGPTPMLKAAAKLSLETKVPAYMSCETRMGCGVGACLVCACDIKEKNGEIVRKRACVDGPVFRLEDIVL